MSFLSLFRRDKPVHVERNSGDCVVSRTGLKLSREDQIRQMIRHELFRSTVNDKAESFEEADDFELDEDDEWFSPYEEVFDPSPALSSPTVTLGNDQGGGNPAASQATQPVPPDGGNAVTGATNVPA